MRRGVLVTVAVLLALGAGGGAALADQTPFGNLGKPEVSRTTGVLSLPVFVDTAACVAFSSGNSLSFADAGYISLQKYWANAYDDFGYLTGSTTIKASTSAGAFTYTLRADLDYAKISADDHWLGSGKVTVTRSDGSRIRGDGTLSWAPDISFDSFLLDWDATPTCK